MNSGAATHKNSSTEQQKQQGQQQQLVYGAYYAVAGDAPTGQRMPSPSDSVDSGSHGSTTATSMNEPFKDMYFSEAIDKETMWDPVEDSPGQVVSGENTDFPHVLLPWGRLLTETGKPTIWGWLTSAPDQPNEKVCIRNTFLEIDFMEPVARRRVCSAPPALKHGSEQEDTGQQRMLVASPWGALRPSSRPPRAKRQQMM